MTVYSCGMMKKGYVAHFLPTLSLSERACPELAEGEIKRDLASIIPLNPPLTKGENPLMGLLQHLTLKAVLWDMDGVIVDSALYHMRSWQETFHQTGITFTEADFRRVFGMRNEEIIRQVLGKDFTEEKFKAIAEAKEVAFRRFISDNVKPFPGVMKLLSALDTAGFMQALVSSTPLENIDLITGTLRVKHYFRVIISGYDVTEGKPSPQGYLLAARRLGIEPENCVVIEDAVAGVQAAKNGGMKCIAVTTTHPAEKLAAADMVVSSLQKVTPVVVEKLLAENKG